MNEDPPVLPASSPATARSKLELLHRDMLEDCERLSARMEQLTARHEEAARSFQNLPSAIREAGSAAAGLVAQDARRALHEAIRNVANACGDLRVATRANTTALPRAAWRLGLLCAASASAGGLLSGVLIALILRV